MSEYGHVASALRSVRLGHRAKREAVGRQRAHAEARHAALVKCHVASHLDTMGGHDAKPFQPIHDHARPRPLIRDRAGKRVARFFERDAELLNLRSVELIEPICHRTAPSAFRIRTKLLHAQHIVLSS